MSSYIKALVIQKNNSVFVSGPGAQHVGGTSGAPVASGLGVTMSIPCPAFAEGGVIDGDYWAVPVNEGVAAAGFIYDPYNLDDGATAPNPQAFQVVRISSNLSSDVWYAVGTSEDYIASCDACCDASPVVDMPTLADGDVPIQVGCQVMCQQDADGNYFAITGLPSLVSPERYYPVAVFNDVNQTGQAPAGYTSVSSLLAFLNATWSAIGTWTSPATGILKVTQTDGPGTDELCIAVYAISPSA